MVERRKKSSIMITVQNVEMFIFHPLKLNFSEYIQFLTACSFALAYVETPRDLQQIYIRLFLVIYILGHCSACSTVHPQSDSYRQQHTVMPFRHNILHGHNVIVYCVVLSWEFLSEKLWSISLYRLFPWMRTNEFYGLSQSL